jgi:hypothetical protein
MRLVSDDVRCSLVFRFILANSPSQIIILSLVPVCEWVVRVGQHLIFPLAVFQPVDVFTLQPNRV